CRNSVKMPSVGLRLLSSELYDSVYPTSEVMTAPFKSSFLTAADASPSTKQFASAGVNPAGGVVAGVWLNLSGVGNVLMKSGLTLLQFIRFCGSVIFC